MRKNPSENELLAYVDSLAKISFKNGSDSDTVLEYLKTAKTAIKKAHEDGASGTAVCSANSRTVDNLVAALFEKFCDRHCDFAKYAENNLAIVALGGYGRAELCPESDIDITFIYGDEPFEKIAEFKKAVVDEIMYGLWNGKLKLGHSSRTVAESVEDASNEILIKVSLLDARLICGSGRLFGRLQKALWNLFSKTRNEFITGLLRLKKVRHKKYEWTPFYQEPNIKNGIGALRDYQTMVWIGMLKFRVRTVFALAKKGYLKPSEYAHVRRAQKFLLRVRNQMHYEAKRENDVLDLASQVSVAKALGFSSENSNSADETFMRKVYFSFRDIDAVSKASRKRLRIALPPDILAPNEMHYIPPSPVSKLKIDGFVIKNGVLEYAHKSVFKHQPARLIKVFRYAQKYAAPLGERLELLIKDSLGLIDGKLRFDRGACDAFMEIMSATGYVGEYLFLMYYHGVLGKFIPEFGKLTCLVQHEIYHRYTADIHTLNCIFQLDKVFSASVSDGTYGIYHKVCTELQNPSLLYLMLLLHDIGKAYGIRNHSKNGLLSAAIAMERLGVPESDKELVLFIIEHHLDFSRVWQTHDIENGRTTEEFAAAIQSEEKLRYLFIATFCDSKATSPDLWNSYKESLHEGLYYGTLMQLANDEQHVREFYENRKKSAYKDVLTGGEYLGGEDELNKCMAMLPENYFLFHGKDDLLMHLKMIETLEAKEAAGDLNSPVIEWRDDPNRSVSVASIVFRDKPWLFYRYVSAFAYANLSILSCRILIRSDGITMDSFFVTGPDGGFVQSDAAKMVFDKALTRALSGEDLFDEISSLRNFNIKKGGRRIKPVVKISHKDGEKNAILIIEAPDSTGLLSRGARIISQSGFSISYAMVNTDHRMAFDNFHIHSSDAAVPTRERLEELKKNIMENIL